MFFMNAVSLFLQTDNKGKARLTNCGKLLENFYENLVCKTKVKLVNKENISVLEITIT